MRKLGMDHIIDLVKQAKGVDIEWLCHNDGTIERRLIVNLGLEVLPESHATNGNMLAHS